MIHRNPESAPPLFARPPDTPPRNDAAPLAGGAGVNGPNTSPNSTLARLPLRPPVRNGAPETSRIAADQIAGHAVALRVAVLNVIRERGEYGATDQEIQTILSLSSDTEVPRRWELANVGAVVASGRQRKTRSNRPAIVWVLSEFAPKPEGGAA